MSSPLVALHNIHKHFGKFPALKGIDFSLYAGEVHCLVGENGCGKSTLIKILAGVYAPDKGAEICFSDAEPRTAMTPQIAKAEGIHVIWQDLSLFPDLTVAENIAFDQFVSHPLRAPKRTTVYNIAQKALARLGVSLTLTQLVGELDIAQRQLVAIAKVLTGEAKIIIMDEPTASLTAHEVKYLLDAVRRLKAEGIAIIFVSHRLAEVQDIADRVTVIRDGERVLTREAEGITPSMLTEWMTGQAFTDECRPMTEFSEPVLTLKDWSKKGEFTEINFSLYRGEIVGITGLLGAGRTELALSLFGMSRPDSGQLFIEGKPQQFKTNRDAISAGVAYVSEDRLNLGLIQAQSIQDNSAITVLDKLDGGGFLLTPKRIAEHAKYWISRFTVKAHDATLPVSTLSGGNQQRIVLAKWLATTPKVLILDAPTVGVDVGAKSEIFSIIRELASTGLSILLISDEVSEVYYQCDRVFIMRNGRLGEVIRPQEISLTALEEQVYG